LASLYAGLYFSLEKFFVTNIFPFPFFSQVSNSSSVSSPLPQTPPAIPGIPYNSVAAGKMHTPPVQSTAAMAIHPMHQAVTNTASTPTASTSANILASPKTTLASPSAVENTSSNVIVQQQQPPSTIQAPPTVSPVAELKEENAVSSSGMASTTLIRTRSSSVTSSTATSLHEETSQFSTVVGGGGGNLTSSPITSKAPLPLRFNSSAAAGGGATTSSSSNPSPFSLPTFMSAASSAPPSTTTPAGRTSDLSTPSRNSEQHQESQHSSNDVGNNVADTSEFNGKVANLLYNSSFGSPMITQKSREPQEVFLHFFGKGTFTGPLGKKFLIEILALFDTILQAAPNSLFSYSDDWLTLKISN